MKSKKIIAAIACCFCGSVYASDVSVYGMVDAYVQLYNGGNGTVVDLGSGGKGGSRIGIKGTEDLGGGTSVFFRLENGFFVDNGTNTTAAQPEGWAFQREAVLGIRNTDWGTFSFGRQYTLNFGGIAQFDAFACSLGSTINNFMAPAPYLPNTHIPGINGASGVDNLTRRDNSFVYESPSFGGLKLSAMVSLGEQNKLNSESEMSNKYGNSYAAQAVYRKGAFGIGFTYTYQNLAAEAPNNLKDPNAHAALYNLGASYDFGFTKPSIQFEYKNGNDQPWSQDFFLIQIGTSTPLLGGRLGTTAAYYKNQTLSKADAYSFGIRYDYSLSKRTMLYAGTVALIQKANAQFSIEDGPDSSFHYPTSAPGNDVQQVFFGIRHQF